MKPSMKCLPQHLLRGKAHQKRLTDTFVGLSGRRALPGPVVVERLAPVTLRSRRVVLALAH